jgi:hypothetical protein
MWQIVVGLLLGVLVLIAAAIVLPLLGSSGRGPGGGVDGAGEPAVGLPWQVEHLADGGTRVFQLKLGGTSPSRLEDAHALWPGEVMKVAVLTGADGRASLEAYLESIRVGGLQGKLLLTGAADTRQLQAWVERSPRREPLPSGAHQHALSADDLASARLRAVSGLVFLPAARLDEATVQERFGPPAERLAGADGTVHLLYPTVGVAVTLQAEGRSRPVLQYVAPADFGPRLSAPLRAPPAVSAADPPASRP